VSHPSKRKGNTFEREIVQLAKVAGLEAERAYASNGRALGEADTVDVVIAGVRVQCKRRKALPAYLRVPDGADVTVFREDRGESLVLMRLEDFLVWVRKMRLRDRAKGVAADLATGDVGAPSEGVFDAS
jgi:Holliday junction resolvase